MPLGNLELKSPRNALDRYPLNRGGHIRVPIEARGNLLKMGPNLLDLTGANRCSFLKAAQRCSFR